MLYCNLGTWPLFYNSPCIPPFTTLKQQPAMDSMVYNSRAVLEKRSFSPGLYEELLCPRAAKALTLCGYYSAVRNACSSCQMHEQES